MPEITFHSFAKPIKKQPKKTAVLVSKSQSTQNLPKPDLTKYKFNPKVDPIKHAIFEGNDNLFVTGQAGTGKSTILKEFVEYCKLIGKNVAIVAPTGIAAINVGGVTIHSFFQIDVHSPNNLKKLTPIKKHLLEIVDILIIDEISMVSDTIFGIIDKRMNQAKFGLNPHNRSFGGARLILLGDLFQLGPVFKDDDQSGYFFESNIFQKMLGSSNIKIYELTKVWRQSESGFLDFLTRLRRNNLTPRDYQMINTKVINDEVFDTVKQKNISILCTVNKDVNSYNHHFLKSIDEPEVVFEGVLGGNFEYYDSLPPVDLILKKKALVVFVKNDLNKRWVNGDFGIIEDFAYRIILTKGEKQETKLYHDYIKNKSKIKSDILSYQNSGYVISNAGYIIEVTNKRTNIKVEVEKITWEKKVYEPIEVHEVVGEEVQIKNKLQEKTIGNYNQFPIKIGYAITVHKSQGMTLCGAVIDFSKNIFGSGIVYVAFSRIQVLDNLYLTRAITPQDIRIDERIIDFYENILKNSGSSVF